MYLKLNNETIEKYPYTIGELRRDNPQVSFPRDIPETTLQEYGMFKVKEVDTPQVDHTKNVNEDTPKFINNEWVQVWEITPASTDEIAEREAKQIAQIEKERANAYRNESDPLFFKWQRGESTEQEWLDKIAEIKTRYPKD